MDDDCGCKKYLEHLGNHLDGEASPALTLECETHVAVCASCRHLLVTCRQTIRVYRLQPPPPIPAALHRKMMDRVGGRKRPGA